MPGERFINIMQRAAKGVNPETDKADIVMGVVTSTAPLLIKVENRFEVGEDFLLLSPFCFAFTAKLAINLSHTHSVEQPTVEKNDPLLYPDVSEHDHQITEIVVSTSGGSQEQEIELWPGLQVGDVVRMLRIANGQKFYVLDRG